MLDGLLPAARNKPWRSGGLFVRERQADTPWPWRGQPYLPYIGHPSPWAVELDDGSVLAIGMLFGKSHELSSARERNAAIRMIAALLQQGADDALIVNIHLVRHKIPTQWLLPEFGNAWCSYLARRYRETVLDGRLFTNIWLISTIIKPRNALGGVRGGKLTRRVSSWFARGEGDNTDVILRELDDLWLKLARTLEGYGLRRLGLREEPDPDWDESLPPEENRPILYSEIAEALHLILTAEWSPCPVPNGRLGEVIYADRVIFGPLPRSSYEIKLPDRSRFGAMYGLRHYMHRVGKGRFDPLLRAPFALVISQSFGYLNRPTALGKSTLQDKRMEAAGDKAGDLQEDLQEEINKLSSGKLEKGWHHFSCAVYADSMAELNRVSAEAHSLLANSGAQIARESNPGALEPAYFAQLPGNDQWRARPGKINTENFAHFITGFAAFPRGSKEGWWGPSMLPLKTRAGTVYDLIPHVADVGMWAIFGTIGSGKTVYLNTLLAMVRQYMTNRPGAIFRFGKDRDGELLIRAMGGRFVIVRFGEDSGLSPLKGLRNTPPDRAFLLSWVKGLIQIDGAGGILPADEARLARGIAAIMKKPAEMRSLSGLREYLGWKDPGGAGARLDRWCRGGSMGWAFDGATDEVGLSENQDRVVIRGFDLTAILDKPEIVNPAAAYLLYFVRSFIDGRRVAISMDECAAYLTHRFSVLFRDEFEDFLLRARKNNVLVWLSTQMPEHILGDAFGASLVEQCHSMAFTPTPTARREIYIDQLDFTPGEFRAITEVMLPGSRQLLLKRKGANAESVIIDFDMTGMEECLAVLSSSKNRVNFYEQLCAGAGTDDPAVVMPIYMARHREVRD